MLSDYQLADLFMKALSRERFEYLVDKIGMWSLPPEELDRVVELSWKFLKTKLCM